MAKISVTLAGKELSEVPLDKDTTTIGRDSENDIYLKNPSVSRYHAKIIKISDTFYIDDLKSTNGTFVNDKKIAWREGLNNNDRIAIGKYTLIFAEDKTAKRKKGEKIIPVMLDSTIPVPKKHKF